MNAAFRFLAERARKNAPLLLIAALACMWGVAVMSRYGVTFDSPALFYAGDRTRYALAHSTDAAAMDFTAPDPPAMHHDTEMIKGFTDTNDPKHYPVLPALICSYTDALFHVKLHWLNGIDGHQIGLVFMHAFALFWFGLYAVRVLGRNPGILATLILATFPCALGHSFNNAKDWPCAAFYGVAVLAAATGILEQRARSILAAGVWLGIALSCKFNAIFVLVTIIAWTPIAYFALYRPRTVNERVVGAYLLAPWIAFGVFFAAWPWLTHGKYLSDWWHALSDYLTFMVDYGVIKERTEWTTYPLRCLIFMTPPVVLACAIVAAIGWKKTRRDVAVWALLLLWTGIPILRCSAPHANFYDANRHFIEYVPGLSAMAGVGAWRIVELARAMLDRLHTARGLRIATAIAGAGVLATGLILPIAAYHPYESTYFNIFIGGLGGAQRKGLFHDDDNWRAYQAEDDYWYSGARSALVRMAKMAAPGEKIGVDGVPYTPQLFANATDRGILETDDPVGKAALIYAAPSPGRSWKRMHELESQRPVRYREIRGGGVIYELFGKVDGQKHDLVSPHTRYDDED